MKTFLIILFAMVMLCLSGTQTTVGQDGEQSIKVVRLRNIAPKTAIDVIGTLLRRDSSVRLAVDERSGAIIVAADNLQEITDIERLIAQIDVPEQPKESRTQTLELTVMMVMEGVDDSMSEILQSPTESVKRLIEEMGANPHLPILKNPRIGGTIMNQVLIEGEIPNLTRGMPGFVRSKSTSLKGLCELEVSGQVTILAHERFILDGNISIQLRPNADEAFSTKLQTRVAVDKEHPVILGLTSIQGVNCLIIVEIR